MGRPAKHSADDLIDAAIEIFAAHGIRAVTLGAVAEATGASNGSVYHRFPDRPSLLAQMWLRTSRRFQDAYRTRLGAPTIERGIATAAWVVDWCRDNQAQTQVLAAGARTFNPDDWPESARTGDDIEQVVRAYGRDVIAALAPHTRATPDQILFALLELPIAVVRRALQSGHTPGEREEELIRGLAEVILRQPG